MIAEAIKALNANLGPFLESGLLTAVYGLTRPGKVVVEGKNYTIPLLLDSPEIIECSSVDEGVLINSEQRGVLFWDGAEIRRMPYKGNLSKFEGTFKAIVWYNTKGYILDSGLDISPRFISGVVALLEKKVFAPVRPYHEIKFEVTGIVEGWRAFQGYTFREQTGYLTEPYKAVGIEGKLKFYVDATYCQDNILTLSLPGCY